MARIRVSPDQIDYTADILDSRRQKIDNSLSDVMESVNELHSGWIGSSKEEIGFVHFYDEVPMMQMRITEILESLAEELRYTAQMFREVDESVI